MSDTFSEVALKHLDNYAMTNPGSSFSTDKHDEEKLCKFVFQVFREKTDMHVDSFGEFYADRYCGGKVEGVNIRIVKAQYEFGLMLLEQNEAVYRESLVSIATDRKPEMHKQILINPGKAINRLKANSKADILVSVCELYKLYQLDKDQVGGKLLKEESLQMKKCLIHMQGEINLHDCLKEADELFEISNGPNIDTADESYIARRDSINPLKYFPLQISEDE